MQDLDAQAPLWMHSYKRALATLWMHSYKRAVATLRMHNYKRAVATVDAQAPAALTTRSSGRLGIHSSYCSSVAGPPRLLVQNTHGAIRVLHWDNYNNCCILLLRYKLSGIIHHYVLRLQDVFDINP